MSRNAMVPVVLCAALIAAACSSGNRRAATSQADTTATSSTSGSVQPQRAAVANAAPASTGVPTVMTQAEGLAEDVQDDISGGNWSAAGAKATQMNALPNPLASTGASPEIISDFALQADSLSRAVQQRNRFRALVAANRISRTMNEMMANYPTRVPIEVAYMDVAGRDAEYDADQGEWQAANDAAAELQRNYAAVQAHVKGRDVMLDNRVSAELTKLHRAIASTDQAQVNALAKRILDDVDNIEKTY